MGLYLILRMIDTKLHNVNLDHEIESEVLNKTYVV